MVESFYPYELYEDSPCKIINYHLATGQSATLFISMVVLNWTIEHGHQSHKRIDISIASVTQQIIVKQERKHMAGQQLGIGQKDIQG